MNANYVYSFLAVTMLFLLAWFGVSELRLEGVFGGILPVVALLIFIVGFISRVIGWARSPVPFCITTTCGQQKSLPFIKENKIDNPSTKLGVVVRMFLEVVFFRSLFRNTRMKINEGGRLSYHLEVFLWLGALLFHWAFFTVLVRHLRFFLEPVPQFIGLIESLDSFFRVEILYDVAQFGMPGIYVSGLLLFVAVTYLLLRRIFVSQVKYISLIADYFPLLLILGIALTGILMRYFLKVDVTAAKDVTMGWVTFQFVTPASSIGTIFYVHIFLVCVLLVYFPFSKLMHAGGVFLSPTRNMTANSREVRHINPWNYPVAVHTYEEYEDEFREKMIEAGLPVDKMPDSKAS